MLRRPKDDKKETPADAPVEPEAPSDEAIAPTEERIAPLEEFRGKADQWMKETAAQLARVATHVQQDEKRQSKLDQRLAEFEDRIQSMLTLTEALSVGDNPFVKSQGEADPTSQPASHTPPARPHPLSLSDEHSRTAPPEWGTELEGEPVETQLVRLSVDRTPEERPSSDEPARSTRGHPNDPAFESYAPEDAEELSDAELARRVEAEEGSPFAEEVAPPPAQAEAMADSPQLDTDSAEQAERRLMLLQWAGLLSRNMHRIDIDAFLETYLHTGWVRPADVERVRALAADLGRHTGPPADRLNREELHVRTILLISRLSDASGDDVSARRPLEPNRADRRTRAVQQER